MENQNNPFLNIEDLKEKANRFIKDSKEAREKIKIHKEVDKS